MSEVSAFLAAVVPQLEAEVVALQTGDVEPRIGLWSHKDPLTLFGAEMTRAGWDQLEPAFRQLAESFSGGESCQYQVEGAGVSGNIGYIAGIERSVASRRGAEPVPYVLRVTTIFRREDGRWRVVHRHADRYDEASRMSLP